MRTLRKMILAGAVLAASPWAVPAQAGWSVGIGFGGPGFYRPYYRPYGYGYYYRPYPVYVAPPPVIVQSAPVVQTVPVAQPVYATPPSSYAPPPQQAPAPTPVPAPASGEPPTVPIITASSQPETDALRDLNSGDDRVRAEAAVQLGRLRSPRAAQSLARLLASDRSATVREAAARGLGLIAAPASLPALQQAAQADDDRDVRRSAAFAAEVIRGNLRGR